MELVSQTEAANAVFFRQCGLLGLARLLLGLLGLPLLFQRLLSRLLFHALLRVLVLGHVLTSYVRRGSAGRIVALPSSSTSTT